VRFPRVVLLLLLLGAVLPASSAAQEGAGTEDPIPAGTRVRVSAPTFSRGKISGRVTHVVADTLFIAPDPNSLVAVPISAITGAEVSRGIDRWRRALEGAGMAGLTAGTLFGLVVFAGDPNCDYCLPGRNPQAAAAGAVVGAVLFAPIGAIIGASVGSERWEPIAPNFAVRYLPHPAALGLGISIGVP
jgi:hypothetical protein